MRRRGWTIVVTVLLAFVTWLWLGERSWRVRQGDPANRAGPATHPSGSFTRAFHVGDVLRLASVREPWENAFVLDPSQLPKDDRERNGKHLAELIFAVAAAPDAEDFPRPAGQVRFFGDQMIITGPARLHRAAAEVLGAVRSPNPVAPPAREYLPAGVPILDVKVPDRTFINEPLDYVIDELCDSVSAWISVGWEDLEDLHVRSDTLLTLDAHNMTLRQAIDAALRTAHPNVRTALWSDGDSLELSSLAPKKAISIRVYDVTDLITDDDSAAEVLTLIREAVDSQSWIDNGGRTGSLKVFGKAFGKHMIVTQSAQNHNAIRELLAKLREPRPATTRPATRPMGR